MAVSADVIEMRAAIEQVWAELESIPSLKDEQKAALEAFKRKFALHKRQWSCTDMFTWWACLNALLSRRHMLRWSDWLIWPVNHQHRQMVYPISNQYFRALPKTLQRNDSRWKCWAYANHSIWRSQVTSEVGSKWSWNFGIKLIQITALTFEIPKSSLSSGFKGGLNYLSRILIFRIRIIWICVEIPSFQIRSRFNPIQPG